MIKTYISALLVVFLAGTQMVWAQEGMDDVFAQLDGGQPAVADVSTVAPAAVEAAPAISTAEMLDLLFKKGVDYYKVGNYDSAISAFDAMLAIDKYNSRASTYKKRAALRIASRENTKQEGVRVKALADVDAAWNPVPKVLSKIDLSSGPSAQAEAEMEAVQQMEARLKAITIPGLDFRDAIIKDVVLFLSESSRRLDSTGKGVNILLMGMDADEDDNTVTTSMTDISLYNALRVVAETASLKFEIKPNAVVIMPADYVPLGAMVMKSYDILSEVGIELESVDGDSGGADDLFGDSSASDSSTGPVDVAAFFSIVDFPEGSSATYRPRFNKLVVKNTLENLKAVEAILADLDEKAILDRSQQVEIEAKFVEFNEGAFEEMGFNWNVYGSGNAIDMGLDQRGVITDPANNPSGDGVNFVDPITGQKILNNGGRPGQNLFGTSQRSNQSAFNSVSGLLGRMGGVPSSMLFGNRDIDLKITAMEQDGSADVLSAPKVTTKSGSEAIIRVAETHRYPQDYDVETGQRTSPVVKPQDWEDFDIGVSLKVTPVVNPDSDTIDLELHPESVKFLDFEEYRVGSNGYTPPLGSDMALDSSLIAKMPYFRRRSIETQITIADGHTIAMGGLVDERTETFRDQVPYLGDIPYLGRLFRTEGSRSVKKNLVIYVTVKKVDASGLTTTQRKLARQ